jgi:hypothetical protein
VKRWRPELDGKRARIILSLESFLGASELSISLVEKPCDLRIDFAKHAGSSVGLEPCETMGPSKDSAHFRTN